MEKYFFSRLSVVFVGLLILVATTPVAGRDLKPVIAGALESGDTTLAISLINKEIDIDKSYHLNYFTLGSIHFARAQYVEAKVQFEAALDKKSKHYESLYFLAKCHLELGEIDEAEKLMEKGRKKAKKIKDWFEDGYGQVMMARERYVDADLAFRQAILINETNADYHIHLGDANFYQGIPSIAVMEYEKALEVDTAGLEVYFHWADACLEMKDYTCAMEKLKVVLVKDSTHAPAWMRAGGIYFKAALSSRSRAERTNRFKEVVGSYRKYFELTGASPDSTTVRPYFELGMAYVNINAFEEAAGLFDSVLSIPYVPRDIYFHLGKALWGARDYVKSGEMLLKHISWVKEQDGDYKSRLRDSELYRLLGDAYYYRKPNQFSTAVGYYTKSLKENPNQKRIAQNMAVAYHSMKSYKQALQYYDIRLEFGVDSASASLIKNAGYCALNIANYEGEGDEELEEEEMDDAAEPAVVDDRNYYEVACEYMVKYLEFRPDDAKILMMMGNTNLFQLADCAAGVKYFEQLLAVEPNNCDAKKSIGYAYFGGICTKNFTKALRYLSDAYKCVTSGGEPCDDLDLVVWIAQCYHLRAADTQKNGGDAKPDFKAANEWYNKVLKCEPNHVDAKEGIKATQFEF